MNDDLFNYLVAMGQMSPEEAELKKKQAMVDALRSNSMASIGPMENRMVSGHYVPKGIAGAASQLGQAYMASKQQQGIDAKTKDMNSAQAMLLEQLRRRRMGNSPGGSGFGMDLGMDDGYQFGGQ